MRDVIQVSTLNLYLSILIVTGVSAFEDAGLIIVEMVDFLQYFLLIVIIGHDLFVLGIQRASDAEKATKTYGQYKSQYTYQFRKRISCFPL